MPDLESSSSISVVAVRASQDEETSVGAWTLVWVLYVTKLVTVILVFWAAHSYETAVLVTVTTWFWFGPLIALTAAPLLFRYRLRTVRARRHALIEQEWSVSVPASGTMISAWAAPKRR